MFQRFAKIKSQEQTPALLLLALMLITIMLGVVTAIAPPIGALLLLPASLLVILIFAFFHRDTGPISDKTISLCISLLLGITVFWPTYFNLHLASLPALNPRRIFSVLLLCTLIYCFVGRLSVRKIIWGLSGLGKIALGLAFFLLFLRLTTVFTSPYLFPAATTFFWESVIYFSAFFLAVIISNREYVFSVTTRIFIWIALICGCVAVGETLTGRNFIADFLMPFSGENEMLVAMLQSRVRDGNLRAQGPFEHPLLLAEFGSIAFMFGLALFLWAKGLRDRLMGIVGLLASTACILLSFSRSALVCVAVGAAWILSLWLLKPRKPTSLSSAVLRTLLLVGALLIVAISLTQVVQTVALGKSQAESESTAARTIMLQKGIALVEERPLLGWGIGTAVDLAGIKGRGGVPTLDNYLVMIAVESGLPYLILFCAFMLLFAGSGSVSILRGISNNAFVAAASGAILSFLIMRSVLGINYNVPIAFLLCGMLLRASMSKNSKVYKAVV